MANKLGINKPRPAELSSLSVYPSAFDRSQNLRRYSSSQRELSASRQRQPQPQTQQSLLFSASSQSQQSFSQGVTFSQPISQLSQDDPTTAFEEWRCNREGRPFSSIPPARTSESLRLDDSSRKLSISKTSSLIQQLNNRSLPESNNHVSEDIVKRLEILDEGLSKVITMLDLVQGDVQKLFKAVQSASVDSEDIKQKMTIQDSSLQLLLKEDENIRTTLTTGLNKLSKQKIDASNLASLFDEIHSIPATLTKNLCAIKTDLFTCIRSELQTVRESVKSRLEGCCTSAEPLPCAAFNVTKAVLEKGKLPSGKNRISSAKTPATTRKGRPRNASLSVKQSEITSTLQNGHRGVPVNQVAGRIAEKARPTVVPAHGKRRARQNTPKKKAAAVVNQSSSYASLATINPTILDSSLPSTRKGGNSLTVMKDSEGWLAPRTAQGKSFQLHSVNATKVEKNYMVDLTFEMEEEGESSFVAGYTSSKTRNVTRNLDEDEATEIRRRMMKARRKRQRSTCVSLCD